jgi:hypothetical protein
MIYTKKIINEIRNYPANKIITTGFLHCKTCLMVKPDNISPSDFGLYEIELGQISLSNHHTIGIIIVRCKRCKKIVWDSRHLEHAY